MELRKIAALWHQCWLEAVFLHLCTQKCLAPYTFVSFFAKMMLEVLFYCFQSKITHLKCESKCICRLILPVITCRLLLECILVCWVCEDYRARPSPHVWCSWTLLYRCPPSYWSERYKCPQTSRGRPRRGIFQHLQDKNRTILHILHALCSHYVMNQNNVIINKYNNNNFINIKYKMSCFLYIFYVF